MTQHTEGAAAPIFSGALRDELETICARYPSRQAALLPALWIIQRERGWVSASAMEEIADLLGCTAAHVKGVVTFYTMYHQHPVGRHFIQVCTTSPCGACGAEDVVRTLLDKTGCGELGVTSPDGRFTVVEVECLGACGFATPLMINDEFLESVTPARVPAILAQLK
jgi:NADH dehydrogenase (ubiquinone) flavoprotein 2